MDVQIDHDRLAQITRLARGAHKSFADGVCAMEAVAYIAREPFSDGPECACPVLSAFCRSWNDALTDNARDELLLPIVPRLVGTRGGKALEERRALMAADWLVRTHTPAWLRLAGLTQRADALASLPEITSMAQIPSIRGPLEAARNDAAAAGAAAWAAAWAAARDAGAAARDAGDAAWDAAWDAAREAAGAAAAAAAAAARDAAWDAAWDAAVAAAGATLRPTQEELQCSAIALVERMIVVTDADLAAAREEEAA